MKTNPILDRAVASENVALAKAAQERGVFPFFSVAESASTPITVFEGRELVNLGSNNYLGLSNDERVIEATVEATRKFGAGITGSRLMNGNTRAHEELEELLCEFTGAEAALVFTTGYTANLAALSALCAPCDTAIVDAEIHASLYDGLNMAGSTVRQFRHNNMRHLTRLIDGLSAKEGPGGGIVVVDGIYSMRGDAAPLVEIADLCDRTGALLFVDEAHGIGVAGPTGAGAVEAAGVMDRVDVTSYVFSKGLAACGGAIVGSNEIIGALKVSARPFLFTTSNTPGSIAASTESLRLLMANPWWPGQVLERAKYLRDRLIERGIPVNESDSAILTVPIRDTFRTLDAWRALWGAGVFVNPILSPAVRSGNELLRLSVMRNHSDAELDAAAQAFDAILPFLSAPLAEAS